MGIPQGGRRPMREMVGRSIRRVEDPRLLRGQGCYVDDLHPTGLLHAAFLRSPHAHARLRSLDLARARSAPGIVAAFEASDLPEIDRPMPATSPHPGGPVLHTPHPLVGDVARYAGEIL